MLLIRDTPIAAESLSSFRQRVWRLNGHRLFPVFPPELRRTDPDLQGNDEVLRSVAEMVNMSAEEMRSHTLWPHPLLSYQQLGKGRRIPRWVSLLQYARHGLGTGSHFCPVCLNDGGEIYFRIQWRLSVSLACPLHRVQMQNRCPECAFPAWPYAAASFIGYFERDLDIDQCPRCFAQLRNSSALKETSTGVFDCADAVTSGNIRTSAGALHKVPLEQWFCALRSIMNIALRSRSRKKVYADVVVGEVAAMLDRAALNGIPFDRLAIEIRRQLVAVAWPLLENWPNSFLDFSRRCNISVVDFSEDRRTLPRWFVQLIDIQLGRPSRSVSGPQVDAVIHDLKSQGLPVNVERVGKIVGSRDAEAVRTRLSKRHVATADETELLAVGLKLYMSCSLSRRISSKNVRARNVIALIVSIMSGSKLEDAVQLRWPDVQKLVDLPHEGSAIDGYLRPVLADAVDRLRSTWPLFIDEMDQGAFFVNHSGNKPNLRGPRDAILYAMKQCDERLWRRPWVFFKPRNDGEDESAEPVAWC